MSAQKFEATSVDAGGDAAISGEAQSAVGSVFSRVAITLLATTFVLGACQSRLSNPFSGSPRGQVQAGDLPPLPAPDGLQPGQPFDPNAPAPTVAQPGQQPIQQPIQQAGNQTGAQPFDPAAAAQSAPALITPQPQIQQPAVQPVQQVAPQPVQPAAPAVQLSRADMLGAWQVASSADNCQLFMTLTTWTGGYRATTKGCTSVELANITAWDLSANQVLLVGATGSQVASLVPAGGSRFSGQTKSGSPISVSRN